ncbi:hypothetical protein GGX14DRAFT_429401 [Mycena pura]|uniref:Uncharacterized protein n=1 Tax=Mycena pura TaxID=153505 RepID=A0AAD6VT34_9AGAR|nr:hypothetical protein GGX14DRAFT_429401 [Mycena pura]
MPKVDATNTSETTLRVSAQQEIKKYTTELLIGDRGLELQELEVSFSTADHNPESKRGAMVAALVKRTPNLKKLTLNFSGHLHTWGNCLGEALTNALCSLKQLEEFRHHATTAARTDFTLYSIMKLVSAWPNLRVLYISGDTNGSGNTAEIPPATCALESVTFERCMSNFEEMAPMFAGSTRSLRSFEAWTMGYKEIDAIFELVLPSIESIRIGGCNHPTAAFIRDKLSTAPNLESIHLGGDVDRAGTIRTAFATALRVDEDGDGVEDANKQTPTPTRFPALRRLAYPAEDGTYNTGRGRNARTHEYDNVGESALLKAANRRGIYASRAHNIEYKVEGLQRRAVFARRAYW